jgi:hypothetical protein
MVFDPQRMCWLKLNHHPSTRRSRAPPSSSAGVEHADDESDSDDPFAGLDDLEERKTESTRPSLGEGNSTGPPAHQAEGGAGGDEWLVGEEFDVGPEFVRRQREEEARWKRKVEAWVGGVGVGLRREGDEWRWAIRDVLLGSAGRA